MIPGTICEDIEFTYTDGTKGKKLFIVLNDGAAGYYIVIKTTSKEKYKGTTYGCRSTDRFPNFFLPKAVVACIKTHG